MGGEVVLRIDCGEFRGFTWEEEPLPLQKLILEHWKHQEKAYLKGDEWHKYCLNYHKLEEYTLMSEKYLIIYYCSRFEGEDALLFDIAHAERLYTVYDLIDAKRKNKILPLKKGKKLWKKIGCPLCDLEDEDV